MGSRVPYISPPIKQKNIVQQCAKGSPNIFCDVVDLRVEQDEVGMESYRRAQQARDQGVWDKEVND